MIGKKKQLGKTNQLVFVLAHLVYVLIHVFICVRQSPDVTSLKEDLALHSRGEKTQIVTFSTHLVLVLIRVFTCARKSPDVTSLKRDLGGGYD